MSTEADNILHSFNLLQKDAKKYNKSLKLNLSRIGTLSMRELNLTKGHSNLMSQLKFYH